MFTSRMRSAIVLNTLALAILLAGDCKKDGSPSGPQGNPPTSGQITFQTTTPQGQPLLWRISADSGSVPENLSERLDSLSLLPGTHRGPITLSPDGAWLVFLSERFDSNSQGWHGLTIARADLQSVETIVANGQTVHGDGGQATAGGTSVVYVDNEGPHTRDLFIVHKQGNGWTTPICITALSPYNYNYWPVLRRDSAKVLFDAGPSSFPSEAICEVNLDGTGFRIRITKNDGPPGYSPSPAVHSPCVAPNGDLIFEAEWGGPERVWRLRPGESYPSLFNSTLTNDNSPNVLPNGNICSLWLGSAGGNGLHEIKLMTPDGSRYYMLTSSSSPFPEVDDIGLGCGPAFSAVGVKEKTEPPHDFTLEQNFPNPFNPSTVISYQIPASSVLSLKIYNMLGQQVATLVEQEMKPGSYEVTWDASRIASGTYLYRLQAGSFMQTKKLILLR